MGLQVSPSVAIVGAGWAGLSAAVRLAAGGARVTVFESGRQAGGRARSVEWNGITVDNGQHLLVGAYSATLAIMQAVGVDATKALRRIPLSIEVPGQLSLRLPKLPAPLHLAVGLLGARGASLLEKISAARFMQKLQAMRYRLPEDITVADWLEQNGQQGVLRTQLWNSLCLAALNTRPEEASAQIFANVLRDTLGGSRAATDMLLPATDLGRVFPEQALQYLRASGSAINLATRVDSIDRRPSATQGNTGHGWQIKSGNESAHFDHVVVATAARAALDLLPSVTELAATRTMIDGFEWEPIGTAYLQYPKSVHLPHPLLALNQGTTQWLADRGQLGGPGGLLAHVLSAHGPWEDQNNGELVRALHETTNRIFLQQGVSALPLPESYLVIRERRATFRCSPCLKRPPSATALSGLWLAGDYVASDYPGTLEAAVRSGEAVARDVLRSVPGQ